MITLKKSKIMNPQLLLIFILIIQISGYKTTPSKSNVKRKAMDLNNDSDLEVVANLNVRFS